MVRAWRNFIFSISFLGLESRSASSQIAIPDLLATLLKQFAKQQAYSRTSVPLSTLVPMDRPNERTKRSRFIFVSLSLDARTIGAISCLWRSLHTILGSMNT